MPDVFVSGQPAPAVPAGRGESWRGGLERRSFAVVFGLLQFASTFLIAILYGRYMNKRVDPLARELDQRYVDATGGEVGR